MKKETIIALIDEYVSSLSDSEKKNYEFIFDASSREHKPIKEVFKTCSDPIKNLAQIVQELEQELKDEATKQTKGNSFVKRSKLISKLLSKCDNAKWREGFYEEINGEKMQCCIINGCYGFAFKNPLDIPMNDFPQFSFKKCIPDYKNFEKIEFDIADIKTQLKTHKAKKDKTKCIIQVGQKYYDAQLFINCVDGLGGEITFYQNSNTTSIDVFESENGIAILCPVRH